MTISGPSSRRSADRDKRSSQILNQQECRAYRPWPRLAFAVTTIATVVLAGWLTSAVFRSSPVERLLAQSYTEKRTLELRIAGARNSKFRVGDESKEASFHKTPALLKAEVLIAENLTSKPNDPKWLQAKGRADLLGGNWGTAVKSLERAREYEPDSPALMVDLATALYARNYPLDRGNAFDWLSKALVKVPEDPIIPFNRAIVAESIRMPDQAKADWEYYLKLESHGSWSDEASARLKKLQEELEEQDKGHSQHLLSPPELQAQPDSPQVLQIVDGRIEEYLHDAILDWLPRAYPANLRHSPDKDARAALVVLSKVALANHRDAWFDDLLAKSKEQRFGAAVHALSAALAANDRGDYDEAQKQSILAEQHFTGSHNLAGVLQARFQRLFALQFIRNGQRCARLATQTTRMVLRTPYTWLQAQLLLEESSCLSTNADIGQARSKIAQALASSQMSKYQVTFLRCISFSAGSAAEAGDLQAGWIQALEGLQAFWSGSYPVVRGYSLYTTLSSIAEQIPYPHLQVAVWTQAIALIDSDPDLLQRGMAHFYLAQAAMDAHILPIFDREYQQYSRLLDLAPTGAAEKADRGEVQLATAKLEIRRGYLHQGHDRLNALLSAMQGSGNTYRAADFYATLGQLELRLGAIEDADRHLRSGLLVTEHILGTLRTDKERMEWERKASFVYRSLVEEKLQEGDITTALEVWEWYLGAAIRESAPPATFSPAKHLLIPVSTEGFPISTLTAVTTHLPLLTRQTVLSYALLKDGVAIWAFDNRGIFFAHVHRDPQEIERLAQHFLELCSDPASDLELVHKYSQDLYTILITPIAARLESDRGLIIEAEGALTLVPFEAFADSTFHYLGEERAVVSSLGIYYDLLLRPLRPISQSDVALVVAVPAPKGFTPLPNLDTETDIVASRFSKSLVFTKNDATLHAVLNALPSATAFYFAGHAVATPKQTGLLMADLEPNNGNARLLTAELLKPELLKHLQIAILAACGTNKGSDGSYGDITSLARTMVRAGVPSVVASRWEISTGAANRLSLPFVFPRKLSQTSAHPYYWAALNQFGGFDIVPR